MPSAEHSSLLVQHFITALAWRPGERTAGEQVQVQVIYILAGVRTTVDHHAIAAGEFAVAGDASGHQAVDARPVSPSSSFRSASEGISPSFGITRICVSGLAGRDVTKRQALLILVDDVAREYRRR